MAIALHHEFFTPRDSLIHRWPARSKLLCLLTMMFSIAMVEHLVLLPVVLLVVLSLYGCSRLPLGYLLRRLPYPGLFIIATVILLPLTSGQTIVWQWGWLAVRQEGLDSATLIAGRFLAIVTLGFLLLGSTPFLEILRTLRSLKVPPLIADMTLLTYRYLFEVTEQLATMRQAMKLRGYGSHPQSFQRQCSWLSSLVGSLLLRSYEQSQRVYQAMRLRGYGHTTHFTPRQPLISRAGPSTSRYLTPISLAIALSFLIAEWSLRY